MTPLGPFVVQNNGSDDGYLNIGDGTAQWGRFDRATVFTNINDVINFVIKSVHRRPDNWVWNSQRSWSLREVEPVPPVPPNYRLTGRSL